MDIERMHEMIEKISECTKCEVDKGIENVDTYELGEAIDMLKDLAEAMYYRTLTKAMNDSGIEETLGMFEHFGDGRRFYDKYRYVDGKMPHSHMPQDIKLGMEYDRDMDRERGRMYYTEPNMTVSESNYDKAKRHYTEVKELHKANTAEDKEQKMKSLDGYMKELSCDVTELLHDMTAEERTLLKAKLSNLVSKL